MYKNKLNSQVCGKASIDRAGLSGWFVRWDTINPQVSGRGIKSHCRRFDNPKDAEQLQSELNHAFINSGFEVLINKIWIPLTEI